MRSPMQPFEGKLHPTKIISVTFVECHELGVNPESPRQSVKQRHLYSMLQRNEVCPSSSAAASYVAREKSKTRFSC